MNDDRSGAAARPARLRADQYRDAGNLDARIELHRRFSTNPQGWLAWLFEQIDATGGADLLELGCGPGSLWQENAARIPRWKVTLSDFSTGMVGTARRRRSRDAPPFEYEVADASAIPHPDASFDCVLANHMLYHVEARPRALEEIRRVLRPGGLLCASTLSETSMDEITRVVRETTSHVDYFLQRVSAPFSLENGRAQLNRTFDRVELRRYEDSLRITETPPLLAYLRSLILDEPFSEAELAAIGDRVQRVIDASGAFHVGKDSGVFLAR